MLGSARNIAHVARHDITPEEVEDVLFSPPLDARRGERDGMYLVFGHSRGVVTARDVDKAERRQMKR